MTTVKSIAWPLIFTYAGPVFGKGFLAQVELCGRLLAVPEIEGVWLDGVNPEALRWAPRRWMTRTRSSARR